MGKKRRKKLKKRIKKVTKASVLTIPGVGSAAALAKGDLKGAALATIPGVSTFKALRGGAKGPGDISTEAIPSRIVNNQEEQRKSELRRRFARQASRQSFGLGASRGGVRTLGGT